MDVLQFASASEAPAESPAGAGVEPELAWDLDVDAFLDDYLKESGPGVQDPFGNFLIDVQGTQTDFPTVPVSECAHQEGNLHHNLATTLTSDFDAANLGTTSDAGDAKPSRGSGQRRVSSLRAHSGISMKAPQDAKTLRKQLALQEKNRRAQRRFRERQKQKVEELTAHVEQLTAQLNAVMAEKNRHETRAGVLENALASRDMHYEVAGNEESPNRKQSPVATAASRENSDAASTEEEELAITFQDDLTLSVNEGQATILTASEVKGMTPAELAKYYKAYVNELAGCLVETNGQPPCSERIRRLVDEVCLLCTRVALVNPAGAKHFTLTKVVDETGTGTSQHADDRVPQMVRALGIDPQQRTQLSQLRRLFIQKLSKIVNDRKDVHNQLMGSIPGGTSHRQMALRYLAAHDGARKLRDNMREEHILVLDFLSTIFKHVLSAHQVAQFMIHSFPYTPDCLALSTWVAAEDGDADALAMLAAEAQGKQQQQQQQQAANGLQGGMQLQHAMYGLPEQQGSVMSPPALYAASTMPVLPNGAAMVGNMPGSAQQVLQFGSGNLMHAHSTSYSTGTTLVNNLNGMLKPGMGGMSPFHMSKAGCFAAEVGPAAVPVSPHVVTMTSSSR